MPRVRVAAFALLVAACGRDEDVRQPEPAPPPTATAAPRRTPAAPEAPPAPRPLDALLPDLRSDDPSVRSRACIDATERGQPAVDQLLEWLALTGDDDRDRDRRDVARSLLPQFGHAAVPGATHLLSHADADARYVAVDLLSDLRGFWVRADDGPDVAKALYALWTDPAEGVREAVRATLARCAPASACLASPLAGRLDFCDSKEDRDALDVISSLGPAASAQAQEIAKLLSAANLDAADAASKALSTLGPDAATALPAIRKLLAGEDAFARRSALDALEGWGDAAMPAASDVVKLLDSDDVETSRRAATRLVEWGAAGPEVVDALARAMSESADQDTRDDAFESLMEIAKRCPARRGDVARLLEHGPRNVRIAFTETIGNRAELYSSWAPELAARLRDEDPDVRLAAICGLSQWKEADRATIDACVAATSDPEWTVRNDAIRLVRRWTGVASKASVDSLTALLDSDEPNARRDALEVLSAVAPDVARLRAALRDSDAWIRLAAIRALGRMGPTARDAVPDLTAALSDEETAASAARVLAKLGVPDDVAVRALTRALETSEGTERRDLLEALERFGSAAASAAQAVAAVPTNEDAATKNAVARTLLAIAPDRAAAVEALLASDADPAAQVERLLVLGADGAAGILRAASRETQYEASRGVWRARDALKDIGGDATSAVMEAARSPDAALRIVAVGCLDLVDRARALAVLEAAFTDADARVRATAVGTTARLSDAEVGPLVGRLSKMLDDPDVSARIGAVRAVGRLGRASASDVPRLRALFTDGPMSQRVAAGCAIHRITGEVETLLPTFETALRGPASFDDSWADTALCAKSIGPRAAPLADAMGSALLRSYDCGTQIPLLQALTSFGPAAAPALSAVRAAAMDELQCSEGDHGTAIQDVAIPALAAMGPAAAAALPDLRRLARQEHFAQSAADAIRAISSPR